MSRKIYNDITYKRRFQLYYNRFILAAKVFFALFFLILILTKKTNIITDKITTKFSEFLQDYDFVLENVVITGQNNIKNEDILNLLNADRGTPIFSINLEGVKKDIEKNPWIKSALIERKLPNTIIINLTEREVEAIWQVNKELFVIDQDGEVLKNITSEKYPNLIHVVGQDANIYASKLVEDLNTEPILAKKIINAVRFGQRRWDLNLHDNINVKMPQDKFLEAYKYLADMEKENKLFGNKIKTIDLRDIGKIYIERSK
ncbi:MAG: FtsQ-type POTRA domain-containing protein [Rickettsiaceae bacterium]|nr:FtsQ-type POTRA domain-containing protein [Rickettsiaceae bacterium]